MDNVFNISKGLPCGNYYIRMGIDELTKNKYILIDLNKRKFSPN